jgi:hypothetical protein
LFPHRTINQTEREKERGKKGGREGGRKGRKGGISQKLDGLTLQSFWKKPKVCSNQ